MAEVLIIGAGPTGLSAACFWPSAASPFASSNRAWGMNLGVEDAYVFAGLIAAQRLEDYEDRRRPVVESVIGRGHVDDSFDQLRLFQLRHRLVAELEFGSGQVVAVLQARRLQAGTQIGGRTGIGSGHGISRVNSDI